MSRTVGMMALVLATGLAASALSAAENEEVGPTTREWLELQRSGKAAGPAQRLSAPAEARAYQRYLDAFTHPIPEFYEERESFLADSDTGS